MKVTYARSHSFKDKDGVTHTMATQLYQIGVYAIMDNNPSMQCSLTPKDVRKIQTKLKKEEKAGNISELTFGEEITVTDKSGFWEDETALLLKELEKLEGIFIEEGKEYEAINKYGKKESYQLAVKKIDKVEEDPLGSTVQFSCSPITHLLDAFKIAENLYECTVSMFQRSITVVQ